VACSLKGPEEIFVMKSVQYEGERNILRGVRHETSLEIENFRRTRILRSRDRNRISRCKYHASRNEVVRDKTVEALEISMTTAKKRAQQADAFACSSN
jgi:hypothetical protein